MVKKRSKILFPLDVGLNIKQDDRSSVHLEWGCLLVWEWYKELSHPYTELLLLVTSDVIILIVFIWESSKHIIGSLNANSDNENSNISWFKFGYKWKVVQFNHLKYASLMIDILRPTGNIWMIHTQVIEWSLGSPAGGHHYQLLGFSEM